MFTEDLSIFVQDFGIDVTFTREAPVVDDEEPEEPTTVATARLILDSPASEIAVYDRSFYDEKFYEARVLGAKVSLLGIASAVAAVQRNDIATINSIGWFVVGIEPDGTGMMTIHLSIDKG